MDSANRGDYESSKINLQKISKYPSVVKLSLLVIGNKNDIPWAHDEKEIKV